MESIRYEFGIRYEGGMTSGHFVNDIGASHEEALRWIIEKKVSAYGLRALAAVLSVDGESVAEWRAKA